MSKDLISGIVIGAATILGTTAVINLLNNQKLKQVNAFDEAFLRATPVTYRQSWSRPEVADVVGPVIEIHKDKQFRNGALYSSNAIGNRVLIVSSEAVGVVALVEVVDGKRRRYYAAGAEGILALRINDIAVFRPNVDHHYLRSICDPTSNIYRAVECDELRRGLETIASIEAEGARAVSSLTSHDKAIRSLATKIGLMPKEVADINDILIIKRNYLQMLHHIRSTLDIYEDETIDTVYDLASIETELKFVNQQIEHQLVGQETATNQVEMELDADTDNGGLVD